MEKTYYTFYFSCENISSTVCLFKSRNHTSHKNLVNKIIVCSKNIRIKYPANATRTDRNRQNFTTRLLCKMFNVFCKFQPVRSYITKNEIGRVGFVKLGSTVFFFFLVFFVKNLLRTRFNPYQSVSLRDG